MRARLERQHVDEILQALPRRPGEVPRDLIAVDVDGPCPDDGGFESARLSHAAHRHEPRRHGAAFPPRNRRLGGAEPPRQVGLAQSRRMTKVFDDMEKTCGHAWIIA